ncbi:hypothetical protein AXE65_09145 [Ventosimonas gracilis]|uniref:Uncharacterized protein n=1 Tax=Ventosimonas gracilis TaxID=1680762 RepID=A0A139SXM8_9GAMM|nr:hypothetical protein [Ventosimonas gracilis]KXU39356.1 hypothetical protein AXE65_09145 [Ventosimonas gracilis]
MEINTASRSWTINDSLVSAEPGTSVKGKVEFSDFSPYLAIGWGHQNNKSGFAFIADLGISFGKAKTKFDLSDSVHNKLIISIGSAADGETARQRKELAVIKIWPQAYIGVSYNW